MIRHSYLLYLLSFLLIFSGCKEDEVTRISPTGEFNVSFDFPQGEITAPTKLILVNRSRFSEKFLWKFPNAKTLTKAGISDQSSSEKVVPDTLVYALPGTYKVTLTAWQGGKMDSISKELKVLKMKPRIVVPDNILILGEFEFRALAFKFPDKAISFSWNFDEPGLTSTDQNPKVIFKKAGLHTVTLTVNDGEETLVATQIVNVQGEIVKSLYFTDVKTGKLYKQFFTQKQVSTPIQLLANVGLHPWSLTVSGERVVISNAGANVLYTAAANADGRLFSVDLNGGSEKTITTATGSYVDDPFASTVDNSGNVWWLSRNTAVPGMRSIALASADAPYPAAKYALTAAQAGATSVFGWIDGGIQIVNNEVWYSKHGSAGKGIYRISTAGVFLETLAGFKDLRIRSFAVDTKNGKVYFVINFLSGTYDKGLYVANLDGSNIKLIDAMANFSTEGGANEFTSVTSIAIDNAPDDGTEGYVYYGYRDATDVSAAGVVTGSGSNSGVKRYALSGTKVPEFFIKGFIPYGIAIDHVKRGNN